MVLRFRSSKQQQQSAACSSARSPGATSVNKSKSKSSAMDATAAAMYSSSGSGGAKSKFSFDKLFFGGSKRSKQKKLQQLQQPEALVTAGSKRDASTASSSFFTKKATHDAVPMTNGNSTQPLQRPPPITTAQNRLAKVQHTPGSDSSSSTAAGVRLCQSPGGRSNMQLAIPVTPPSATSKARGAALKLKKKKAKVSAAAASSSSSSTGLRASAIYGRFSSSSKRATVFSLGPWRESTSASASASSSPRVSAFAAELVSTTATSSPVECFLHSLPRDVTVDVTTVCAPQHVPHARAFVRHLLHTHVFAIRSTKWAAYFLQLVARARTRRDVSARAAVSLRWVICAYVQHEVHARRCAQEQLDAQMQRKMTDYRVALQCISGTTVLKFGRKGRPHLTQLVIENGESFRWTSKLLTGSKKSKKAIALASVVAVRAGPTTEVLERALQKGTLALQDAKCTMSLVTPTRTFDIKAKSAAEREWLHRSFSFLVELAREHAKRVAQQVELSIMKRMEMLSVWKHGRKGRPHRTHIFINRFGEISWQGRSGDSIQIDEIAAIELGQSTPVFRRSLGAGLAVPRTASYCFSLVTRTRTLDLETESEHMRDWFVVAFRYLMDKVQEKTAAIKREKAEKQLKLLQELCGGIAGATPGVGAVMPTAYVASAARA